MKKIVIKSLLLILLSVFTFSNAYLVAQELRVEPPSWWQGMATDSLQVMLYGENIADLEIKIRHPKLKLLGSETTTNQNYLWINLDLSAADKALVCEIELSREKKIIHTISYKINASRDLSNLDGFDQSDAIYLITPDRFANGDLSNDNINEFLELADRNDPSGRHGGDLKGIADHLDYIKAMGFTAIWLNPIIENNNPKYSYHGYAATDFYKVDARFGTNEEYLAFVKKCHDMDLKVIMDMIHNHCSLYHWWMADIPSEDWVNTWTDYTETNHKKSTLQDVHAAEIDRKSYTDGWFVRTMPDLNQRNPLLANYLIQNSIWWSMYLELDGIRMDTYSYPDKDFMQKWVQAMNKELPMVSIVGEEWSINPAHIAYWQKDKHNPDGFVSDLEYLMDFPTNQSLGAALTEEEGWNTGLIKIYDCISNDFQYPHPEDLFMFLDNHDMVRGFTTLQERIDLMKTAMIFCATTRGIPQFYYGTEILMTSPAHRDDGRLRADYPGGWATDTINAFSGAGLSEDQKAFRSFLTELLTWRKSKDFFKEAKLLHYIPKEGVYVYFRYDDKDKVMVILNKNNEDHELQLGRFEQMLNTAQTATGIFSGETIPLEDSLLLKANESYIFEIR